MGLGCLCDSDSVPTSMGGGFAGYRQLARTRRGGPTRHDTRSNPRHALVRVVAVAVRRSRSAISPPTAGVGNRGCWDTHRICTHPRFLPPHPQPPSFRGGGGADCDAQVSCLVLACDQTFQTRTAGPRENLGVKVSPALLAGPLAPDAEVRANWYRHRCLGSLRSLPHSPAGPPPLIPPSTLDAKVSVLAVAAAGRFTTASTELPSGSETLGVFRWWGAAGTTRDCRCRARHRRASIAGTGPQVIRRVRGAATGGTAAQGTPSDGGLHRG